MNAVSKDELERRIIPCARLFGYSGESAEWYTAAYLVDNLDSRIVGDYRILMNYNLRRESGGADYLEVDLIVVNRFGVFLIEVKDWTGSIEAYDGYWLQGNNVKHDNIFGDISHKAKVLYGKLFGNRSKFMGMERVSVVGLIVLFRGVQFFQNCSQMYKDSKNVFGRTPELKRALSSVDMLHSGSNSRMLVDEDIQKICTALYDEHDEHKQIIRNYSIKEKLLSGDLFDAYEAVSTTIENRYVRIKRYKLSHLSSNTPTVIRNFQTNAKALSKLGAHPNILQTYDFFPDPNRADIYYEVTELIKGNRLDQLMDKQKQALPFSEQMKYLEPLCLALNHAHKQSIFHRNLNPETIFVTESGIVKLADFDFAKLVGMETIVIPGQLLVDNLLTAPELYENPSGASPASDIFSLGGLWYLLASLPERPSSIELEKIDRLGIPLPAQRLMKKMLAEVSSQRPQSIEAVLNQLKQMIAI